jgi:hypothetical protein
VFAQRIWRYELVAVGWCLVALPAAAITIKIDYTYDTSHFFGSGNPQGAAAGAQAKSTLEAAASFYSTILTDSFSEIQAPQPFHSAQFSGQATWQWTMGFDNPTTNSYISLTNQTVPADQYIVYVGGRSLPGNTLGLGRAGDTGYSYNINGQFTQSEQDYVQSATDTFLNEVQWRGQPSGFNRWGGVISFDSDGSTNWFFNHLALPTGNSADFYSVALHELGHTVGFGEQSSNPNNLTEWQKLLSGSTFIGHNAETKNNGSPVPLYSDLSHWADGKTSVVYGTSLSQETLMDPILTNGTRKVLTELDAAALKDLGWSLAPAPVNLGDYNDDGFVDAADYILWRKYLGQSVALPNRGAAGTISLADYNIWRTNFGNSAFGSGASLAGGVVPEPRTRLMAMVFGLVAWSVQRRRFR